MSTTLEPYRSADLGELLKLLSDPGLRTEYDALLEPDRLEQKLAESFLVPAGTRIARVAGEPAGFSIAFRLPHAGGGWWAGVRIGVAERFRRRGLGSTLLAAARGATGTDLHELVMGAWRPNPAAAGFAARHGFRADRTFWRMERPLAPAVEPGWPASVTMRIFDGGEQALADWTEVYNDSFAEHYHYVPATIEIARELALEPLFLKDGVALAYRDGRCVGFCRNERAGRAGMVAVLGVARAARGIGLGRALLRWAIGYFAARDFERVALVVDGQNESALELYYSEGFTVARTRDIWIAPRAATG